MKYMSRTALFLFLVLLLSATTGPYMPHTQAQSTFAQEVVVLTNYIRAQQGVPPLKAHDTLTNAAEWMSADMAINNYFSHTDSQGRRSWDRFDAFGYPWIATGENIAASQPSPAEAMQTWMESPAHRANILNPDFTETGVGYYQGGRYNHYWVQDFGNRANSYPLIIDCEAPTTSSSLVHLYIYGQGWAEEMRLSNDGQTWTEWQPFQSIVPHWELAPGERGMRAVYVQLRHDDTIVNAGDIIELTVDIASAPPVGTGDYRVTLPLVVTGSPGQVATAGMCP
jgi:uncharacterized protein YkwD